MLCINMHAYLCTHRPALRTHTHMQTHTHSALGQGKQHFFLEVFPPRGHLPMTGNILVCPSMLERDSQQLAASSQQVDYAKRPSMCSLVPTELSASTFSCVNWTTQILG